MTFLYLVPTGMNDPEQPTWGSWAGRYGLNPGWPGKQYYWANQVDIWNGATNRENTLARWAVALQNDFRARLDWCVKNYAEANHPPIVKLKGDWKRSAKPGERIVLDASNSADPDGNALSFKWEYYREAGTYDGSLTIENENGPTASLIMPEVKPNDTIHLIVTVTDSGNPPLSRYRRVLLSAENR